jgi:hypothetical protein
MLPNDTGRMPAEQFRFSHRIELEDFSIDVLADDDRVIQAVRGIIDEDLTACDGNESGGRPRLRVRVMLSARSDFGRVELPPVESAVSTFRNLEFYQADRATVLAVDRSSVVTIHPYEAMAVGHVSREHIESPWTLAHRIFYLPLVEILRFHKAYYVHAGCVCEGDKGILICGASGRGKSTLTYALSRSRFSYLSDDGVFLRRNGAGVEVFGFPERIKLDRRSCSHFEEFDHLRAVPGKRELRVKETRIRSVSRRAVPVALVFPGWGSGPESKIRKVSRDEGLVTLVGQSIQPSLPGAVEEHLDVLAQLAMSVDCYDLKASEDLVDVADVVASAVLA